MMWVRATALFLLWAGTAVANAPAVSMRPEARPAFSEDAAGQPVQMRPAARPDWQGTAASLPTLPGPSIRPIARPFERADLSRTARTDPQRRADAATIALSPLAVARSLRPTVRPAAITRRAVEQRIARARGQVCGDPAIQGETIGAVAGRGACGIDSGVRVRSVAGVTLRPAALMDCRTAGALKRWVTSGVKPAVGQTGGGASSLRVVSHYSCRFRNSASSGRLSEHAFGRAIDIAGIGLRSGREITVLTDWGRGEAGRQLREMWRAACGPFGTVLGPNSNRFHRDHFHFDTARYRSGSFCR